MVDGQLSKLEKMDFKKIIFILGKAYKKKALILLAISLPITFLELLGIGLIIPILSLFVEDSYFSKLNLQNFYVFESKSFFIIAVLLFFNFVYFLKFIFSCYLIYKRNTFNHNLFVNLSQKIYENYLKKKYLFHVQNNSSQLIRNTKEETALFTFNVVSPLIEIIIEIIIFMSVCIFLLFYNFMISIVVIVFFLLISSFWYKLYNKRFYEYGNIRQKHNGGMIKQLQESFGSIKEIIIFNLEDIFVEKLLYHNKKNAEAGIKKDTLINFPRFIFELAGVTTLLIIIIIYINLSIDFNQILISIGVFVFATVRLLPSFAKIVRGLQQIKYNSVVINLIDKELKDFDNLTININKNKNKLDFSIMTFNSVNFAYPNDKKEILKNVNFEFKKGDRIGIIGATGSGKTTLINLISGLIEPSSGKIEIDKKYNLNDYQSNWQQNIGYVAQNVHILDESIIYNVTFKTKLNSKEFDNFKEVLSLVKLDEFVEKLPKKYETLAGENGVMFSGGQCQRLGVARALYRNSSLLVLDEATNALDEETEKLILEKIYEKEKNRTIIHISHKRSVMHFNDKIIEVKDGFVKTQ